MYPIGAAWPGEDVPPPVVFSGRPGRHRPRINSEHLPMPPPGTGPYYWGTNGYLIPAAPYAEGLHRTRSAVNSRPAQVIINNDNTAYDDHSPSPRRPRSAHRERYCHYDHYDDHYERSPSHSRVRHSRRSPSPHHEHHHDHHDHHENQPHHPPHHPSPPDYETERRLKRLEELDKAEEEHRLKVHAEEQLILQHAREEKEKAERKKAAALEAAREEVEKAKKKKEEEEFKKKTIEEYNIKQKEEADKKAKAKEKEDEEFKERLRKHLHATGYSDEEIESIIKNGEKGKVKNHHHPPPPPPPITGAISVSRPTFIKVNRKYLEPETLDKYSIEWEIDDRDPTYIIIKQWIPEHDQDILFEHTRKLRERKQIVDTQTILKKEHDQLLLVRRREKRGKSPVYRIRV